MKIKALAVLLSLILIVPLAGQDKGFRTGVIHKEMQPEDPLFSIQVAKGDKTGAMLSSVFVYADWEGSDIDPSAVNWIKYSDTTELYFFVNYTALFTTKVRFHLIITGPEYFTWSGDWEDARYKWNSLYWVNGNKSAFFKTKGEYKVIFAAEMQKALGGAECFASCTIRIY